MQVSSLRPDGAIDAASPAGTGLGGYGMGGRAAAEAQQAERAANARLLLLADRLTRTVSVARALIATGRTVDLSGFEDGVGLLCAKTLDLHYEDSRHMLPAMLELAAQIDRLSLAVRDQQEGRGQRDMARGLAAARQ
jgi:hypothetical protein